MASLYGTELTPEQEARARKAGYFDTVGIKGVGSSFANPTKAVAPADLYGSDAAGLKQAQNASDASAINGVYAAKEKAAIDANNAAFQQKQFGKQLNPSEQAAFDRQGVSSADPSGAASKPAPAKGGFGGGGAAGWMGAAGTFADTLGETDKALDAQVAGSPIGGKGQFIQISKFGFNHPKR